MDASLIIGDENLISSKRAAESSGYAQDYIGQLARKGLIEARRIGGLWYVSLDSLNAYKLNADTYTPRPPHASEHSAETDSIISFDGHDYVSAARAAHITGYHPDYVGQLARSGKILSRQIGNRWYVDRDQIVSHKSEKDALLGAVQAESVGVVLPKPNNDRMAYRGLYEHYNEVAHPVMIRRTHESARYDDPEMFERGGESYGNREILSKKKRSNLKLMALLVVVGFIMAASTLFFVLKKDQMQASFGLAGGETETMTGDTHEAGGLKFATDWFRNLLTNEITYEKIR